MKLIYYLQEQVRPSKLRGTGRANPVKTSAYGEFVSCIKQNDVNIWFYTKNGVTIAIDSGYKDNHKLFSELEKINIASERISAVFLTHADIDHVGGIVSKKRFAENAKIYIHAEEVGMLLGREKRIKFGKLMLNNPVNYKGKYTVFNGKDVFNIGGIKVECFHVPGHTKGHSAFLVDDEYLFTGDCIAINEKGGHCYFDDNNFDTKMNINSLNRLKMSIKQNAMVCVCTAHNGAQNFFKAFLHINDVAQGTKIQPFDSRAPHDTFKD